MMRNYILKHSAARRRELKYDFMPDLLEIIERPCNKGASVIIWLIFLLMITTVAWSAFFKLDSVITSSGVVVPAGNMKLIQSPVGGMTEKIAVCEGDFVKKGEEILTIAQDINRTDRDRVEYELELMQIQKEIYEKIYNGVEPDEIRVQDYGSMQWVARCIIQEEKVYQKEWEGLELQAKKSENRQLTELQLESYAMQRELEIMEKISSCETKIKECEAEIEKYSFSIENATIKAPVDGYIAQLGINTVGQTVTASQSVASIVPSEEELIFKCYLPDKDIADIKEGQKVNIKLKAFPYSEYGMIEGRITYVSPAAQTLENGGYVYTVHIAFENKNEKIELIPGMTGTAEVLCGQKTVLEYFLEPISKGIGGSMKER